MMAAYMASICRAIAQQASQEIYPAAPQKKHRGKKHRDQETQRICLRLSSVPNTSSKNKNKKTTEFLSTVDPFRNQRRPSHGNSDLHERISRCDEHGRARGRCS